MIYITVDAKILELNTASASSPLDPPLGLLYTQFSDHQIPANLGIFRFDHFLFRECGWWRP